MNILEFFCLDILFFLIKIVFILILFLIFKDKLADYLLDKQFSKTFGKIKDNIMSINFDDIDDEDSLDSTKDVTDNSINDNLQHPTKF